MDLSKIKETVFSLPVKIKGFFSILKLPKLPRPKIERPDFPRAAEKIKSFLNQTFASIRRIWAFCYDHIQNLPFIQRIPEGKRRPYLIGIGGLGCLLLVMIVAFLMTMGRQNRSSTAALAIGFVIPQEELFIPAEPDFVPEFIFEKQPKRSWSLEDIRLYWRKPEISEHWREEIKSSVDKLMEAVP